MCQVPICLSEQTFIFLQDFISATCILAAFLNQDPDKIVYHTNVPIDEDKSRFWKLIFQVLTRARLEIRVEQRPTHVYGQRLSSLQVTVNPRWSICKIIVRKYI